MKNTGVVRRLDELGRITLPMELRKVFGIEERDSLEIYVEDDKNTVFNLEMQTTNYEELPKRSRYYQDIIDLKLIEKGQSYDILKNSVKLRDGF